MAAVPVPTVRARHARRLVLDLGMFAGTILLLEPEATGLPVHEWLGLAIAVPIIGHVTLNWPWVAAVARKAFGYLPAMTRVNQFLNTVLFVAMVIAITSGVMVSEVVAPRLASILGVAPAWLDVHEASANAAVAIVVIHAALHWRWLARTASRLLEAGMPRGAPIPAEAKQEAG